jgi:hypothetical protein
MADASEAPKKKRLGLLVALLVVIVAGAVAAFVFLKPGGDNQPPPDSQFGKGGTPPGPTGPGQVGEGKPTPGPMGGKQPGLGQPGPGVGQPMGMAGKSGATPPESTAQPVAGIPVKTRGAAIEKTTRIAFAPRTDPFALLPVELKALRARRQQDILAEVGGWEMFVVPKPRPKPDAIIHPLEAQPYRRLAGIIRGEAIAAILEEDGAPATVQVVKPGDKVGEWTVQSIDAEKAVLYRPGSRRPNTVVVRLESHPTVGGGASFTGGGGGGNTGTGPAKMGGGTVER